MTSMKQVLALAALLAVSMAASVPAANAQSAVKFLGVGAADLFNTVGVAAFTELCSARPGSDCRHYSVTGKNPGSGISYAQMLDGRNNSIPPEGGNLWVVWDNNTTPISIWAYLSTDSVSGVRGFSAVPRSSLVLDSGVQTHAGDNLIAPSLLFNKQTNLTQADESSLPANIAAALQITFTAAVTDVRPEDAKFVTNRILAAYNAKNLNGLGYGVVSANCPALSTLIGCPILSSFTSNRATPVQFSLPGAKDPFTNLKVPKADTIIIGAVPVLLLYNSSNPNGLGATANGVPILQDISSVTAAQVWNGKQGGASFLNSGLNNVPLSIISREPLSATGEVFEYSIVRTLIAPLYKAPKNSQETGINLAVGTCPGITCPNPLSLATVNGSGQRLRGIGTGEVVKGNGSGVGGLLNLADSVGYSVFSYANIKAIAGASGKGRYTTLDGVDPIQPAYTNGVLPTCTAPCPVTPGTSFPHIRDGSYRAWTFMRFVTDPKGSINYQNASDLVVAAQNAVNSTVPDYVPYVCTGGVGTGCNDGNGNIDSGVRYYHSHFKLAGVTKANIPISNGNPGQGAEYGGDLGGCPFSIATDPSETELHLNGSAAHGPCALPPPAK